jgi:hypothetical protein
MMIFKVITALTLIAAGTAGDAADYRPILPTKAALGRTQHKQSNCNPLPASEADRLISLDARGWVFNRYSMGSATRPTLVSGSYCTGTYSVRSDYIYNGNQRGWVIIRITNNSVNCLEYHDMYGGCRPMYGTEGTDPGYPEGPANRGMCPSGADDGYGHPLYVPC